MAAPTKYGDPQTDPLAAAFGNFNYGQPTYQFTMDQLDPLLAQAQGHAFLAYPTTGIPSGDVGQGNANAQLALQQLAGIASGASPDLAAQQAQDLTASAARSNNAAALERVRAQGGLNANTNLMANLINQQNNANLQSQVGLQNQADARTRALQAMAQGQQLGLGLGAAQYGQQAQSQAAQDIINKFNAQQRQNQAQQNFQNAYGITQAQVGATNEAEAKARGQYATPAGGNTPEDVANTITQGVQRVGRQMFGGGGLGGML